MMEQKKRQVWVDYAKTIGIFLVVFAHMYLEDQSIIAFIQSFHMPLFFFLSGLLYKKEGIEVCIRKNWKRLIVPYLFFYVISYIWWIYFVFIRNSSGLYPEPSSQECIVKPFVGLLLGGTYSTGYAYFVNVALWFLVALFEMKLIMSIILKLKNHFLQGAILLLLSLVYLIIQHKEIDVFFSIPNMLYLLPFFALGFYTKQIWLKLSEKLTVWQSIILFALFLGLSWYLSVSYYFEITPVRNFKNYMISISFAVLGIGMIFFLSNVIRKNYSIIRFVSNNTLTIMGIHIMLNGTLAGFAKNVFSIDTSQMPVVVAFVIAVMSICCSLVFAYFMHKFMPVLIGEKRI